MLKAGMMVSKAPLSLIVIEEGVPCLLFIIVMVHSHLPAMLLRSLAGRAGGRDAQPPNATTERNATSGSLRAIMFLLISCGSGLFQ